MLKNGLKKNRREGEYTPNYGKIMTEYEFLDVIDDELFTIKQYLVDEDNKKAIYVLGWVVGSTRARIERLHCEQEAGEKAHTNQTIETMSEYEFLGVLDDEFMLIKELLFNEEEKEAIYILGLIILQVKARCKRLHCEQEVGEKASTS